MFETVRPIHTILYLVVNHEPYHWSSNVLCERYICQQVLCGWCILSDVFRRHIVGEWDWLLLFGDFFATYITLHCLPQCKCIISFMIYVIFKSKSTLMWINAMMYVYLQHKIICTIRVRAKNCPQQHIIEKYFLLWLPFLHH